MDGFIGTSVKQTCSIGFTVSMFTNNDKGMMGWSVEDMISRVFPQLQEDLRTNLIESLNLDWYRGLLGTVNQEPVMFAGTIRYNLQLGVERTLADGELEEALCLDLSTRYPIDSLRSGSSGKGGVGRSEPAIGVIEIHRSFFWTRRRVR